MNGPGEILQGYQRKPKGNLMRRPGGQIHRVLVKVGYSVSARLRAGMCSSITLIGSSPRYMIPS